MGNTKDLIAWVDVETTGTTPWGEDKAQLLEIACLITDTDLNILDPVGYQAVVQYSQEEAEALRNSAIPFVQQMHDATGLWGKLPDGTPLAQVDEELHSYITGFASTPRSIRLGGNSVRLDLNFAEEYLPKSYSHLHYRMIDVTTVGTLFDWWGIAPPFQKQKTHSAMADIRESIAELRYLKEKLNITPF